MSGALWRPSGVAQGLHTPLDTPNRVWRPSEVDQGLHTASRHLQTPQIESRPSGVAQVRAEARRGRQGPGRRSKGPGALSTPRGRDLGSPGLLASIPAEPSQSQHAMAASPPYYIYPYISDLHFLTKSQAKPPIPKLRIRIFQVMGRHLGTGLEIAPLHHPPSPTGASLWLLDLT